MKLGDKIRELRLQKQMTQKDVVGEFMTRNMLSKIENGSATPSIRTLEYLANALGEPVGYFLDNPGAEVLPPASQLTSQLIEIETLANQLLCHTSNSPDTSNELLPHTRALALCIKTYALLAQGSQEAAFALLEEVLSEPWAPENAALLYKAAEDCCTLAGDFRNAYYYATKRLDIKEQSG